MTLAELCVWLRIRLWLRSVFELECRLGWATHFKGERWTYSGLHLSLDVRFAFEWNTTFVLDWCPRQRTCLQWFLEAYRTPSKIFETPRLIGTNMKILWTSCWFGLPWLDWQSFEISWAWSCLNFCLHECTVELLEASMVYLYEHLHTQSRTHLSSALFVGVLLNW